MTIKRILLLILLLSPLTVLQTNPLVNDAQYTNESIGQNVEDIKEYTISAAYEVIFITNNSQFSEEGFTGNGSVSNPYVLQDISPGRNLSEIYIRDTTAHFIIRNCSILSTTDGYSGLGFDLTNIMNGRIESCTIVKNYRGFDIENSDGLEIVNNTIYDSQKEAINAEDSNNLLIANNTISDSTYGVYAVNCDYGNYTSNIISNSTENGIYLSSSGYCKLINNTISENGEQGIYLRFSGNSVISNNTFFGGGIGIYESFSSTIQNNTLDTKPIIYLQNEIDEVIDGTPYGQVIMADCDNVNITAGSFTEGIVVAHSADCTIVNVSITNASDGIYLLDASRCNLSRCNITNSSRSGIYFDDTFECILSNNTFERAGVMFQVDTMTDWHHSMIDNTVNGKPLYYCWDEQNQTLNGEDYGQIVLVNCYNISVVGGEISDTTTGVIIGYSDNCTLDGVQIYNSTSYGFHGYLAYNLTIRNSEFFYGNSHGVYLLFGDGLVAVNNTAVSNAQSGMNLHICSDALIQDNTMIANALHGIELTQSYYSIVRNNTASNNSDSGMDLSLVDFTLLENNTCSANVQRGMYFSTTDEALVIGNEILDNQYVGIDLQPSCYNNSIFDNLIAWNDGINAVDFNGSNYWDDRESIGNVWGDWMGVGVYRIGDAIDNYPRKADTTTPTVQGPDDSTGDYPFNFTLTWFPNDNHPCNYSLLRNNRVMTSVLISEPEDFDNFSILQTGLNPGIYEYIFRFSDTCGNTVVDSVIVTIEDNTPPTITSLPDIEFSESNSFYRLQWTAYDLFPATYRITRNGSTLISEEWQSDEFIYDLGKHSPGAYNYTITVYDESGNSASDSVIVTVTANTNPTETSEPAISLELLVIFGVVGAVIILVGFLLSRKK